MGRGSRRARGSPVLLLLLLWPVPGAGVLPGNTPGKPVIPHWVLDGQRWHMVTPEERVSKPDLGLVALEAEGQELVLELEKKHRLLAPGYTETHYSPDGQPVVLVPSHTDHCHYHGRVRGFPASWVVLSTCSGMSGLIALSSNASYYLRPLPPGDSKDSSTHKIFRTEQLLTWKGHCGHRDPGDKRGMASLPRAPQSRDRREAGRSPRYLELYLVADHTLFLTQQRNLNRTKQRLLEVANYVDQVGGGEERAGTRVTRQRRAQGEERGAPAQEPTLGGAPGPGFSPSRPQILRTLDIQVVLSGLEVWTERDRSRVTPDANATLWAFLQWRRGLWARRPHDSAQLLTGRAFRGDTVGLAPVEGMCRAESSGGVSTVSPRAGDGAKGEGSPPALTAPRALPGPLGAPHWRRSHRGPRDRPQPGPQPRPRRLLRGGRGRAGRLRDGGGHGAPVPARVQRLQPPPAARLLPQGGRRVPLQCPGARAAGAAGALRERLRGGRRGVRLRPQPGQECWDLCCFSHNCSLRAGAQCAHGDCCTRCLLKPTGVLCRQAAGDCDLPEFCTGASPNCPRDIYLLDGSPCARGRGYCRDGACPTLEQQCQQLWGPGSRPAPEACFQLVNCAGDAHGNCGQDSEGHFVPCAQRDTPCGKLQCQGGEQSPLVPYTVPVDSTIHLDGSEVTCRGVLVLHAAQLDLLDMGLVEPGTQCGPRMVCQDRRCQNTTFQELERCLTTCHGHGVCNSNHNCHCAPGWAPPFCDKPGFGGSLDSSPVQLESRDAFLPAMLLSFLLPLLPGAGLAWCCYRLPGAHLQRCPWSWRRDPTCSGDHPLGSVHPMELGPTATREPWPLASILHHCSQTLRTLLEPNSLLEKPGPHSPTGAPRSSPETKILPLVRGGS
ncbi:disintegrin and metalloproteinase domain-containing protein 33 isoform X3 [Lemur catta]|uniref:disintegrin and metalloproteinase domain-containing protein 33 isoform X3 n=1 Tax=Lemur catta TaxID=9447 RepID=UPI001E268F6C|nr:disintegrin and metalloproteinase domain-containing protein 33 isoform X3 [Lemur catta]